MNYQGILNSEELKIEKLLNLFLNARVSGDVSSEAVGEHLDDDTISAFVEGDLNREESVPVIKHLVDCSFCRNVTAELVKLDLHFADEPVVESVIEEVPSKITQVLNGILAKIFGNNDGAVFAHQEPENESDDEEESKTEKT
ncbi:MAG: hypothetical protein KIS76_10125 [Pyrinomonadaceae bacterium]|nr:hypothetical protein [Pyrinomonadaceae bacterium]